MMRDGLRSMTRIEGGVEGEGRNEDEVVVSDVNNGIELKCNNGEESGNHERLDAIVVLKETIACKVDGCSVLVSPVNDNGDEVDCFNANDSDGEEVDCVDARKCDTEQGGDNGEGVDGGNVNDCDGEQVDCVDARKYDTEQGGGNGKQENDDTVKDGNGEQANDDNVKDGSEQQVDNVQTKGRRGRKRKSLQMSSIGSKASVEGEGKKDDEVVLVNVTNEIELKSNSCEELDCNGSLDVPKLRVDANNCKSEQHDGVSADSCDGGQANDDNAKNGNGEHPDKGTKGRRGRKKKSPKISSNAQMAEMSDGVNANNCNVKLGGGVDAHNCKPGQEDGGSADNCNGGQENYDNAKSDNGEQADNGTESRRGRKRKIPQISSNAQMAEVADGNSTDNCNVEQHANDDNAINRNGEQADNGTKGRRGRKRKSPQMAEMIDLNEMPVVQLSRRVLRSRTVAVRAKDLVEGNLSDADDKIDEGIVEDDNKIKLENVEDKSDQPSKRGKKKKNKGRPGRPPQVNLENGDADVTIKKNEVLGSKKSLESGTLVSKVKSGSVASEKKDIRNKIVDMVIQCGWKLQLIPRISKDYSDPVYVDHEGKTHWSITKAYKRLKERIDSGEANDVERAGFIVVPDETLSKLFRITTKKRSDCGVKRSVGVEEKEPGRNRSSSKKTDDSNCEEKSNIGHKSSGRKRKSAPLEGRKKRRFALLARGSRNKSDQDDDEDDESELYNKKRNLLSWMIDLGTIPEGENVQYRDTVNGAVLLEGKVTRDGIPCNCCNEMHTILGFQLHAGSKLHEPLKNIYLGSGSSIFQCMVDSWSKQVELHKIGFCPVNVASSDHNDDTCNICGDGGNLMCCDCCPSTFHLSCLDIEDVPAGDWQCMYCTCKFCGSVGDEALSPNDGNQLITCQLCEEKFHSTCTGQTDFECMNSTTASFCGPGCQKIFNRLQKFVGLKHEMEGGLSWTILQRYDVDNDISLSDYPLKIECNAKLAVAYSVMDECFFPVVDPRSQSEMISNVIYNCGSSFRRLNYSGFYTFILEKGDEVVSTASIRFHGAQLAEMPFIATRNKYRRQGFSRRLLTVIEKTLSSMDIQKLIIPAVSDVLAMWTDSFGFMPLEESTWNEMKTMSIIVFPHTDMLQKPLLRPTDPEREMVDAVADEQAAESSEPKGEEDM